MTLTLPAFDLQQLLTGAIVVFASLALVSRTRRRNGVRLSEEQIAQLQAAMSQLAVYEQALLFYADTRTYTAPRPGTFPPVLYNEGALARSVLPQEYADDLRGGEHVARTHAYS